ncbi:hypothetical protein L596_014979 [Steinernema carpocapsae]|uniref:Uncharacterized protein n=1 Tax=Steinernema carpocapsae TaxID=34508 RepID=A0A4V6A340_STECR|nr:hypothetical protein L596_014979 [Steinernema carpocapsae]
MDSGERDASQRRHAAEFLERFGLESALEDVPRCPAGEETHDAQEGCFRMPEEPNPRSSSTSRRIFGCCRDRVPESSFHVSNSLARRKSDEDSRAFRSESWNAGWSKSNCILT